MKIFCVNLPRGLRGWTSLIYKVVLIASVLPVLDGLQAIGRGNSDMLPGLASLYCLQLLPDGRYRLYPTAIDDTEFMACYKMHIAMQKKQKRGKIE